MKFSKLTIALIATAIFALCPRLARAQGSFDVGPGIRTIQICASNCTAATTNTNYVDLNGMIGVGAINLNFTPDNVAGTATFVVQNSSDATNWSTLANVAISTPTLIARTNIYYATPLTNNATNFIYGTITTPTASTAGFATPYIGSIPPFTNTASITMTNAQIQELAFVVPDAKRYIRLAVTAVGGTGTNYGYSASVRAAFSRP